MLSSIGYIRILTLGLLAFVFAPITFLVFSAGLPDSAANPLGLDLSLPWLGIRASKLMAQDNGPLWSAYWRTVVLSSAIAGVTSTLGIISAYLLTRQSQRWSRDAAPVVSILGYVLPVVFLVIAFHRPLTQLQVPALLSVALLHALYVLPMCMILAQGYADTIPRILDRATAADGARWPLRFEVAYKEGLWKGHMAIFCIALLISWSDIAISHFFLSGSDKLLVDLFVLRYFEQDSTVTDYVGAAVFSLVILVTAAALSIMVALSSQE